MEDYEVEKVYFIEEQKTFNVITYNKISLAKWYLKLHRETRFILSFCITLFVGAYILDLILL